MSAILNFPSHDRKDKKQKKTLLETAPLELSQACTKTIAATLDSLIRVDIEDEEQVEEIDYQWEYHTEFIKVMFHVSCFPRELLLSFCFQNGVLDKHEFLNDLSEIFTIFFLKRRETNPNVLTWVMINGLYLSLLDYKQILSGHSWNIFITSSRKSALV